MVDTEDDCGCSACVRRDIDDSTQQRRWMHGPTASTTAATVEELMIVDMEDDCGCSACLRRDTVEAVSVETVPAAALHVRTTAAAAPTAVIERH